MAVVVSMPQLSDTMRQGRLVKWRKAEGEDVKRGDVLAEVETDKATMDLEAFDAGVLLKRLLAEGDVVPVGAGIAIVGKKGEDVADLVKEARKRLEEIRGKAAAPQKPPAPRAASAPATRPAAPPAARRAPAPAPRPVASVAAPTGAPGAGRDGVRASPVARKIAAAAGLPLSRLRGSGPGGRIVRADVERALAEGLDHEAAPPRVILPNRLEDREIPMTGMRKTIARRLQEAKREIPHYYLQETIRADRLVALRESLEAEGRKASVNDLVMVAVARAVAAHPGVNVTVEGDVIRRHAHVHLAFAVALDDGLITPVVREAERLSLDEMRAAVRDLGLRARRGGLSPDEYVGGTFTVSNLGMYGLENFCAVVNPPAAAILAVAGVRRAAVATDDGALKAGWTMGVSLSCDHRAIDGAVGAAFLQDLRRVLESASDLA